MEWSKELCFWYKDTLHKAQVDHVWDSAVLCYMAKHHDNDFTREEWMFSQAEFENHVLGVMYMEARFSHRLAVTMKPTHPRTHR